VAKVAVGAPQKLTNLTGFLALPRWSPDSKTLALLFSENAPRAGGPLEPMTLASGVVEEQVYEQRLATVDPVTDPLERQRSKAPISDGSLRPWRARFYGWARWPGTFLDVSVLSEQGYFVLFSNLAVPFRQGETFNQANVKDFGYADVRDILAGVDEVEKTVPVNDRRLGIGGWGYGGSVTMWTVTPAFLCRRRRCRHRKLAKLLW
jgi:Prolyl oligopeptidase family